jgi:transcriptional regulator with XRE-family HTH domain
MGTPRDVQHPMNQAVAAELRAEMARHKGLTQQDVVDRSGVPYNTVGKILRGETMIDVKQLDAISLALNIQPNIIIARAERAVRS